MKEIKLTRGKVAIVDDEDFEWLSKWKWHVTTSGYAVRAQTVGPNKEIKIYMHRAVVSAPAGQWIDHINRLRNDCRKENLRPCNRMQSSWNTTRKKSKSGFWGVYKTKNRWRAQIKVYGKFKTLGSFTDINEAARAVDRAAKELRGEFAILNFTNG